MTAGPAPAPNMENYLEFTPIQYDLVTSVFTVGVAAHLAALVYFLSTSSRVNARFRPASVLSAAVMVSAAFLLLRLEISWVQAMQQDPETGMYSVGEGLTFSHTYRYLNWLIDVPLLLVQLLFVWDLTRREVLRLRTALAGGGVLMVLTGFVGQLYEYEARDGLPVAMLVWGAVSTVPYVLVSLIVFRQIRRGLPHQPPRVQRTMRNIGWLFFGSWGLYPLAYLVADVLSKIVYGVLLGLVLQVRSAEQGWDEALDTPQMGVPLRDSERGPGYTEA